MGCLNSKPRAGGAAAAGGARGALDEADQVLVLVGAHGAGKTTAVRHLELASGALEGVQARQEAAGVVREAVAAYAGLVTQQVLNAAEVEPEAVDEAAVEEARRIGDEVEGGLTPAAAAAFARFAARPGLREGLERAGMRTVGDELLAAVVSAAGRCARPDYEAQPADVLRLQWQSVGVDVRRVDTPRGVLRVVDLGGRYAERRKWPGVLNDAAGPAAGGTLVFVAPLDGFAEHMEESPERRQLLESLELFSTVRRQYPQRATVLLLTKLDRFRALFASRPRDFAKCFPSFGGRTAEEALEHVKMAFVDRSGGPLPRLGIVAADLSDPDAPSPLLSMLDDDDCAAHTTATGDDHLAPHVQLTRGNSEEELMPAEA